MPEEFVQSLKSKRGTKRLATTLKAKKIAMKIFSKIIR